MSKKIEHVRAEVLAWYHEHGRHELPWRQTTDPYLILVSELMLQQTQVARVIPKYQTFITEFPTVKELAEAPLGDVLRLWQGLGYNRRAKYLHQAACIIHDTKMEWPRTVKELQQLPGVGPYTAAAICAFAYNQPAELVETNVRQVVIHHFFAGQKTVTEQAVQKRAQQLLPRDKARTWYAALMDYGSYLKQQYGNNTNKIKGYTKQSPFKDSNRSIRGAILRSLTDGQKTKQRLQTELAPIEPVRIATQLQALQAEGLVTKERRVWRLP